MTYEGNDATSNLNILGLVPTRKCVEILIPITVVLISGVRPPGLVGEPQLETLKQIFKSIPEFSVGLDTRDGEEGREV